MSDMYYSRKEAVTLLDVLDRILDKGVVIIGDITISLCDVELLNIKLKLLIASVDKAKAMGIDFGWAGLDKEKLGVDKEKLSDLEKRVQAMEAKQVV